MGLSSTKLKQQNELLQKRLEELEKKLLEADPIEQDTILETIEQCKQEELRIQKISWQIEGSRLDQIQGLDEIKNPLKAAFILPYLQPHLFQPSGQIPRLQKILLYGPPGTGKTLLAESVAFDSKALFERIRLDEIGSKYQYELENRLGVLFQKAANQKQHTIIFMDEIDSLGRKRQSGEEEFIRSQKNTFLQLLDSIPLNVSFVGCTNYLSELDDALLRRFDLQLYVRLPDLETRIEMIKLFLKPDVLSDEDVKKVADNTNLYSGADLQRLIQKARQVSLESWLRGTHFIRKEDGKYYLAKNINEPEVEEISLMNIPQNSAGPPPKLTVHDILRSRTFVPAASKLEDIIRGAPSYIQANLKEQIKNVQEERKDDVNSYDKQKLLIDLSMKILDQPPEKIHELTNYIQAAYPQGVDNSLIKQFFS